MSTNQHSVASGFSPTLQRVAVAVNTLDPAIDTYQRYLGFEQVGPVHESELGFGLRWQTMGRNGTGFIDLIEAVDEESMIAKFLSKRGEGPYLIQLGVDNVGEARADLEARGTRLILPKSRDGDGEPTMFWIHPKSAHGALIEVIKKDGA